MSRTTLLGTLIALTLLPLAAHAADISGTWTSSFDTQIGKQEYTYTFKVEGAKLTGNAKSAAGGETPIQDGKVEGDKVSFVENFSFQGNDLKITYTGTVVSADEIKFHRDVSGIAQEDLVAKRSK